MKPFPRIALGAALFLACAVTCAVAPKQDEPAHERAVSAFERLPIQEGGRVKPVASFARFTLLRVAGTTSPKDSDGRSLDAPEWLLRLALFPELAQADPVVLVEDSQALVAVGLDGAEHQKRDRWEYAEIAPVLPDLLGRAHAAEGLDAARGSPVEAQTIRVAESALTVLRLGRTLDFARHRIPLQEATRLAALFPGRDAVSVADVVERAPEIARVERELVAAGEARELAAFTALWRNASELCADAQLFAWIPPDRPASEAPDWKTPADLLAAARGGAAPAAEHVALLRDAETVVARRTDPAALAESLETLVARVERLAGARRETKTIGLEVLYARANLLSCATAAFLLGFVLSAIGWLRARRGAISRAAAVSAAIGLALLAAAIVARCVIRGRPPVSTLYETVLFVTAAGAFVALVVERIERQGIHLAVASLIGAGGLFLAAGYEALDGRDTMPSLVAVLDTNFWLATHVTAITLGYSAGLLAALLGSAYVLIALVRGARADRARQRSLALSVHGVTCFALCFSVVGTILGGVWANESWGRFWGWDPKENGALLICIAQIAGVHARRAGILRDLGVSAAAAFGGIVVAFSWWGVNLLGVGLHSYGFTSGIQSALTAYYAVQGSIVLLALVVHLRRRSSTARGAPALVDAPAATEDALAAGAIDAVPPALPSRAGRDAAAPAR